MSRIDIWNPYSKKAQIELPDETTIQKLFDEEYKKLYETAGTSFDPGDALIGVLQRVQGKELPTAVREWREIAAKWGQEEIEAYNKLVDAVVLPDGRQLSEIGFKIRPQEAPGKTGTVNTDLYYYDRERREEAESDLFTKEQAEEVVHVYHPKGTEVFYDGEHDEWSTGDGESVPEEFVTEG